MIPFRPLLRTCSTLCLISFLSVACIWFVAYFLFVEGDFKWVLEVCADDNVPITYNRVFNAGVAYWSWWFFFAGSVVGYRLRVVELELKVE